MTVQEMYNEMIEQSLEDVLLGYNEALDYDDRGEIVEIEYTTAN
tara:strand:+ start:383 stop:514 length:132 start_codon:yes stop_codon:yes gene_type:complete